MSRKKKRRERGEEMEDGVNLELDFDSGFGGIEALSTPCPHHVNLAANVSS